VISERRNKNININPVSDNQNENLINIFKLFSVICTLQ
jgi:hypothetical protein